MENVKIDLKKKPLKLKMEKSKETKKEKLKAKIKNKKSQRTNCDAGPSTATNFNETFNDETNIIQMMEHVNKLLKTNPELVKQVSKCVTNVMGDKSLLDKIKLIQDQTLDKSDETDDSLASTNELRQ